VIATQTGNRCRLIATQMASEYARDKVVKALFEAIVEGLDFGPRDLPRPEDREWIRANVAVPLQEATDAALRILVWSVSRALEGAPNGLLERYEQSPISTTWGSSRAL